MDNQSIGKLTLRLMVGGLLIFYGFDKIINGIGYIEGLIKLQNLPYWLAYGVYVGEFIAPLFLILGWRSRWWAMVVVVNMSVAIYLVHSKTILSLGSNGAWSIEVPLFYLLGALAIVFLGSGRYAIRGD